VTVTEPIFTKLALVWQLFIKNLYNEFPETLTNGVAADSRSQMDECGLVWSAHKVFLSYFVKNTYKQNKLEINVSGVGPNRHAI